MCFGQKKVFYLEQSKRKVQVEAKWHEGIFFGIKDESEIDVVGTPHGAVSARSIRRVPEEDSGDCVLFNSIKRVPWELQLAVERERQRDRAQSAVGCPSCNPSETSSTADHRGAASKNSLHQAISGSRGTGTRTSLSGASMRGWDCSRRTTVRSAVQGLSGT